MAIIQKLIIDNSKSNQFEIVVRDETGIWNPSNTGGYGGNNGLPANEISRYIFDIYNLNTNQSYRQIQSDNLENESEYHNPSIARIVNKEDISINSDNFDLLNFSDGVYKINMNVEYNSNFTGIGEINSEIITNVVNANEIYTKYNGIIVNNEIYYITDIENNILILDREISESFTSFKPILKTNSTLILYDKLKDCLNKKIADNLSDCICNNIDNLNMIAELQLLDWGISRTIFNEDYLQAKVYLDLMMNLCKTHKCKC